MTPLKKLAIVVAIQLLILGSVIAFKQYTVWTGETVLIEALPYDPRDPFRGDYAVFQFEISTIDTDDVAGDDYPDGTAYVELRRGEDGYWRAVAVHDDRERSFEDTVLLKGKVDYSRAGRGGEISIDYGFEEFFIPEGSGSQIPTGGEHTLAMELKVDRFGNAVARRLFVDGEPLDLKRRG